MLGHESAQNYDIYAFIYKRDEDFGYTEQKVRISVKARPKPEVFPEAGETSLENIMSAVNYFAESKADRIEVIGNKLVLKSGDKVIAQDTIEAIDGGTFDDWRE